YFASITAMDEQIGRLRNCLKEQSVDRNTLVWFCSDNGPEGNPGPQKRSQGTAEPFRGRKRSLYEGGIRVPGILVWPQEIVQSRESNVPCVTSDFFPTIVDAVGMAVSKSIPYDGISLMPVIRQQQQQRESRISFQFETQSAISGDRYKLVHNPSMKRLSSDNGTVPVSEWELYDLINDPGEKQDIAPNEPEIVTDLKSERRTATSLNETHNRSEAGQMKFPLG
ncbi:MAG: N-acetylgalactosamine 6-sulfate sulfatase, partial [Planctomycetes bacterium]|nr:N-acetylgalactosamine 6-sulfate sulfatase [Planctomycetota bacterium]